MAEGAVTVSPISSLVSHKTEACLRLRVPCWWCSAVTRYWGRRAAWFVSTWQLARTKSSALGLPSTFTANLKTVCTQCGGWSVWCLRAGAGWATSFGDGWVMWLSWWCGFSSWMLRCAWWYRLWPRWPATTTSNSWNWSEAGITFEL